MLEIARLRSSLTETRLKWAKRWLVQLRQTHSTQLEFEFHWRGLCFDVDWY